MFSHFEVNGVIMEGPTLNLQVTNDVSILAVYSEIPPEDVHQTTVGQYEVWSSVEIGDFYILDKSTGLTVIRFPTVQECIAYIQDVLLPVAQRSLIPFLVGGVVVWFIVTRRK